MKEGMRKSMRRGSFTVEASILIPFILFVIMLFLCLCMYLHDRSVLTANAAELAGKASVMKYQSKEGLEAWILEQAYPLPENRLFSVKSVEAYAEVTDKEVRVGYKGRTGLLGGLELQEEEKAGRVKPVAFIRRSRQFKGMWEEEKDG